MKIQRAEPKEAGRIEEFLGSIFHKNSLIVNCHDLENRLGKNKYVSFIVKKNREIIGHFGISVLRDDAIFNMMAVNPRYREKGLAKNFLETAVDYVHQRGDINHAIGYCVLQHSYSEKIHDKSFKPVGLMITPTNSLNKLDPLSKKNLFRGDLAVCKTFNKSGGLEINHNGRFMNIIKKVLDSMQVQSSFYPGKTNHTFGEGYIEIDLKRNSKLVDSIRDNYVCLGLLPNIFSGFYTFGFLPSENLNVSGKIVVSNKEREDFIKEIIKNAG